MTHLLCKSMMAARWFAHAAAAVLVAGALVTPGQARDIGELGGNGGNGFRSSCLDNHVVIGFNMRSGAALDAIVPICIALNPQRTEWTGQAYEPTQYRGGGGGAYQKIACQPGDAVRHLHVHVGPWGDIVVVKQVFMTCQDLDSGKWYDVFPERLGNDVMTETRFSCADGEWGDGIYGQSGELVDKLGFSCAKLVAATVPQPQPPQPPAQGGGAKLQDAKVVQQVQVFDAPGGTGNYIGELMAGNVVQLAGPCREDHWCHVLGAAVPKGDGWVYSGPEYKSLEL